MPDGAESLPDTDPRLDAAAHWCLTLAEGALGLDAQARFQAWLEADPENRRAFEDAVGVWRAVGETSLSPELLTMRRDALHGFEAAKRARWGVPRSRSSVAWAPAAAAALLLLVGGAVAIGFALTPADYRTGVGERRVVVLSDGSKLSLDAATEVKVRYGGHARRLWLEHGRAKFDVAKDAARPFTVAAADKVVRATGTEFTVELLRGEVQVVLYQGHVAVFEARRGARPEPLKLVSGAAVPGAARLGAPIEADELLTPGRELTAPVEAATAEVAPVDPVRSSAWEGGQLFFDHEPLATAVERVNRYSSEKLRVGDAEAAAVRIDGAFTAGDTDAFVEGVTGVFPLRARDTAEGKVLISRRAGEIKSSS